MASKRAAIKGVIYGSLFLVSIIGYNKYNENHPTKFYNLKPYTKEEKVLIPRYVERVFPHPDDKEEIEKFVKTKPVLLTDESGRYKDDEEIKYTLKVLQDEIADELTNLGLFESVSDALSGKAPINGKYVDIDSAWSGTDNLFIVNNEYDED